jgi:hypothetical protein
MKDNIDGTNRGQGKCQDFGVALFPGKPEQENHQQGGIEVETQLFQKQNVKDQPYENIENIPPFLPIIPKSRSLRALVRGKNREEGKNGQDKAEKKGHEPRPGVMDIVEFEPQRFNHDEGGQD